MMGTKPVVRMIRMAMAIVLTLSVTGGHWAILQSAAWARMVIVYSRTASIPTALEQTFDGEHPCCLCKFIQKEKQAEAERELQQPSMNRDAFFCETYGAFCADRPWTRLAAESRSAYCSRVDRPPVPPPNAS